MPILRKQKVREYTTVDNYFVNDSNLSLKGKGMLLFMLSKPDDWKFNYKNFDKTLPEGRRSIQSAIKELRELKYLKMERIKDENNKYDWIYYVYEKPFDMVLKMDNFEQPHFEPIQSESIQNSSIILNTNNNKDKEDKLSKEYTSSFFNREEHNRLTLELIDSGYIDKEDLQLYYYDDFFEDLINQGNSYRDLITVLNYVVSRVIKRNFIDEEGYEIKNKLGYLKNAINSNLNRIKNMPDELYSDDEYDWLNDEEDFEL